MFPTNRAKTDDDEEDDDEEEYKRKTRVASKTSGFFLILSILSTEWLHIEGIHSFNNEE